MRASFISRSKIYTVLVFALLITSMFSSTVSRAWWNPPAHFVAVATKPISAPIAWASGAAHRAMQTDWGLNDAAVTRKERDELLVEKQRLELQLAGALEQFKELKNVRMRLADPNVVLQHARVFGGLRDVMSPTLTIDAGSDVSIEAGMVVATGENLVGRIVSVGPTTSIVQLITSPHTHLKVDIEPESTGGPAPRKLAALLEVSPKLYEGETVFVAVVPTAEEVEVDDIAVFNDDTWPHEAGGFVVGRVAKIDKADDKDNPLLRKKIIVMPLRSLPHLDTVVVAIPGASSRSTP
jgi:cell shape-determining protein MreC